ncbi:MAG: hypothetical protein ABI949_07565 [Ilumatobacteraceae bacterium]
MTIGTQFDLSDGYNRIVDDWYPVFTSTSPLSMPIAACAYPINMGEQTIAAISDDVQPEDYHLRWQMAMTTGAKYHLYCNWQGRAWDHDEDHYLFIDNAVGWVDWQGGEAVGQLAVHVAFGRPYFDNNIASMAVDFYVTEIIPDGTIVREIHRNFRFRADGHRTPLF